MRRGTLSAIALLPVASLGAGCTTGSGASGTSRDSELEGGGVAVGARTDAADATGEMAPQHDAGGLDAWIPEGGSPNGSGDAAVAADCSAGDAGEPTELACTGLYSDWPSRTVSSDVRPYAPGYALWSDGAVKQRWIRLPPGTQIDTSDMDQWTFPVGTKLWKQFTLGGQPVETRMLWKRGDGDWVLTTYAWSADGSRATELTSGLRGWNGTTYEIPAQWQCLDCHGGRLDDVLGFEAVSLAGAGASGLTLDELVKEGLLTQPPAGPIVVPGDPTEQAALGWLHGNCGTSCHNETSWGCTTSLLMRLNVGQLGSVRATDTWNTAVNQPLQLLYDGFVPPWPMLRITPGDPMRSAVWYRPSVRDTDPQQLNQMPPTDSHVVPDAGVALIEAWIASMAADAGPAPGDGGADAAAGD